MLLESAMGGEGRITLYHWTRARATNLSRKRPNYDYFSLDHHLFLVVRERAVL
jgi:hypothetical protein